MIDLRCRERLAFNDRMAKWLDAQCHNAASATQRIGGYFLELAATVESHLAAEQAADSDCASALAAAQRAFAQAQAALEEKFGLARVLVAHVRVAAAGALAVLTLLHASSLFRPYLAGARPRGARHALCVCLRGARRDGGPRAQLPRHGRSDRGHAHHGHGVRARGLPAAPLPPVWRSRARDPCGGVARRGRRCQSRRRYGPGRAPGRCAP